MNCEACRLGQGNRNVVIMPCCCCLPKTIWWMKRCHDEPHLAGYVNRHGVTRRMNYRWFCLGTPTKQKGGETLKWSPEYQMPLNVKALLFLAGSCVWAEKEVKGEAAGFQLPDDTADISPPLFLDYSASTFSTKTLHPARIHPKAVWSSTKVEQRQLPLARQEAG